MRAKKALGQHFLINENLIKSICQSAIDAAGPLPILEVGPGQGALTQHIVDIKEQFRAVDLDSDMIQLLGQKFPEHQHKFIHKNFLKTHPAELFESTKEMMLLGNFPYNISSQIVFRMLDYRESFPVMIGMFQKEVAQRILSKHGSKVYGVPSVLVQAYYTGKTIYKVSPGSFNPPPKVDSSVIILNRRDTFPPCEYSFLKQVVKSAFGVRRKMLKNSLKSFVKDKALLDLEIFTQRPEQLSVEAFIELTLMLEKQREI